MDQARSVLSNPRLRVLAEKEQKPADLESRLVNSFFDSKARSLWPPPLEGEYDYRSRDASKLPGRIGFLRHPDLPWSVVIEPDPDHHRIKILGYGTSLSQPILVDFMSIAP